MSFLGQNKQRRLARPGRGELTLDQRRPHGEGRHSNTTTCSSTRRSGSTSSGASSCSGTAPPTQLDIISVGGTIANRFDSPTRRQLPAAAGQPPARRSRPTNRILRAGRLEASRRTSRSTTACAGKGRQPNAGGEQRLHARCSAAASRSRTAVPSIQRRFRISTQPVRAAGRLRVGPRANDGRTVVRGYTGIYYARTPMLLWAAPMNNFRVPPGDLSSQLPFTVPAGNPNTTLYEQLR